MPCAGSASLSTRRARDVGDFVIVVNAEKISVTGDEREEKRYYRHSGYPGGLRSRTLEEMLARRPEEDHPARGQGHVSRATGWAAPSFGS